MGSAFDALLIAVIYALEVAHAGSLNFIWLESYSMYVVTLLRDRSTDVPWRVKARWQRILGYIDGINVGVSHIFR